MDKQKCQRTLQKRLEEVLVGQGVPTEIAQGVAHCGDQEELIIYGSSIGAKGRSRLDEDFVVGPLSSNITPYNLKDIVETTKEYYGQMGFKVCYKDLTRDDLTIISLKGIETICMALLYLGSEFRKDEQQELRVATRFSQSIIEHPIIQLSKDN